MKLEAKPFNINVMQIYTPMQDHDDEEIETFYQEIQNDIKYAKSDEVTCIMGGMNAKVGDEKYQNMVGMHVWVEEMKGRMKNKNLPGK